MWLAEKELDDGPATRTEIDELELKAWIDEQVGQTQQKISSDRDEWLDKQHSPTPNTVFHSVHMIAYNRLLRAKTYFKVRADMAVLLAKKTKLIAEIESITDTVDKECLYAELENEIEELDSKLAPLRKQYREVKGWYEEVKCQYEEERSAKLITDQAVN